MTNFGPFLGINNRLPDDKLYVPDKGNYLRQAVNVDIDDAGGVRRRRGYTLSASLDSAHSLWSGCGRMLLAHDGRLKEVVSYDPFTLAIRGLLASNGALSYASVGETIFFSNGEDSGRLDVGSTSVVPWALETPVLSSISSGAGTLSPGVYQVALTYTNTSGEESGASEISALQLFSEGGLSVALPTGAVDNATHINVYVTAANGEILNWHSKVAIGVSSAAVSTPGVGRRIPNKNLHPIPAGQIVAEHNGRLLVAVDADLIYSEPWNMGLYRPDRDYIPFNGRITNVVPCSNGVYVTADNTYWLSGSDIADAEVQRIYDYGAVAGTAFRVPHTRQVGWFGDRGVVVGDMTGQTEAIQEAAVAVDTADVGSVLVREAEGVRSVIVILSGSITKPKLVANGVAEEDSVILYAD